MPGLGWIRAAEAFNDHTVTHISHIGATLLRPRRNKQLASPSGGAGAVESKRRTSKRPRDEYPETRRCRPGSVASSIGWGTGALRSTHGGFR